MSEGASAGPTTGRGPSYPYFNLKTAIEKSRTLFADISRHAVGSQVVIGKMGYTPTSSSASKALAALRAFGILEDTKVDGDDLVRFSERGLDIVADYAEGSKEWKAAVVAAAVAPKLHNELWTKYEGRIPPDEELKRYLVRVRPQKFKDDAAAKFIEEFRETIEFAKLHGLGTIDAKPVTDPKPALTLLQPGHFVQWTSGGIDRFPTPRRLVGFSEDRVWAFIEGSDTGVPVEELTMQAAPEGAEQRTITPPPANPFYKPPKSDEDPLDVGAAKEITTLEEGPVTLTLPKELGADSVADLDYWVQGILKKYRRAAGIVDKK